MECSEQCCGVAKSQEAGINNKECLSDGMGQQKSDGNGLTQARTAHFITRFIRTTAGVIPQVTTHWMLKDYLGAIMVRCGIKRNKYEVTSGLYAVGDPNERSNVLVTANYKLSFDTVRKNLVGLNAWLLVLDTKGINVWCAAGKGTFGTEELVRKIRQVALDQIVKHRHLILPQLGAVGVAAHLVKKASGFTVIYGPVRATDIRQFIQAHYHTSGEMRRVHFGWYDRVILIPNDFIHGLRYLLAAAAVLLLLSGINKSGFLFQQAVDLGIPAIKNLVLGYVAGIIVTPLLLPYIPVRSFALKGFFMGLLLAILLFLKHSLGSTNLEIISWFLILPGIASFLAMNFTGSSTFTSLSGVKKEMKIAVPLQITSLVVALILVITAKIV